MTESTQTNSGLFCSFCHQDNDKVGYLIVGPEDSKICDLCVDEFYEFIADPEFVGVEDETITCSFCNQNKSEVEHLIPGNDVYICDKCLDTCSEILQEIIETN